MTPKEKATELFCKMYGCEMDTDPNDIYVINGDGYFIAKDSALICVDLHLEELSKMKLIFSDREIHYKYWEEVKQELNKL